MREAMVAEGTIDEADLGLVTVLDEPQEVVEAIFRYYEYRKLEPSEEEEEIQLNL
jgi:hypothetical protein